MNDDYINDVVCYPGDTPGSYWVVAYNQHGRGLASCHLANNAWNFAKQLAARFGLKARLYGGSPSMPMTATQ